MRHNKDEALRNNHRHTQALLRGGYAKCARCGKTMRIHTGDPKKGRPFYYCPVRQDSTLELADRCRTARLHVDDFDAEVWARIEHELRDPGFIRGELMRRHANNTHAQNTLSVLC